MREERCLAELMGICQMVKWKLVLGVDAAIVCQLLYHLEGKL